MTFEWPIALLALALVPLLVGLLWLSRRRDSRYAIRFSNVGVLAEVAQATRSPWRFVPPVLLLAALAALAVGLARPSVSVSAERKQGTIVLALDRSGSMLAQDVPPDRITASREAAGALRQEPARRLPRRRRLVLGHGQRPQRAELRPRRGAEGDLEHPGRRRHRHR